MSVESRDPFRNHLLSESGKEILTVEDFAFIEAKGLLDGRTVSSLDGIHAVGRHCSVSVNLALVEGGGFELRISFRAFHPELVDWRKRSVLVNRDRVSHWLYLDRQGSATAPADQATYGLKLISHVVPVAVPSVRSDAPIPELLAQKARLVVLQDRLVAQTKELDSLDVQRGRIEEFAIDLYTRRIGERTATIALGWDLQNESLEGATVLVLYVNQQTGAVVERVTFPLVRVESLPAEIVKLFSIEGAAQQPCWFGRWDALLQLATDCFIEGTVVPHGV